MKKTYLAIVVLLSVLLVSCKPEAKLTLSASGDNIGADGGDVTVQVTSNYAWSSSIPDGSLLKVSPSTGTSDAAVTITVPKNETMQPVTHAVTFTATGDKNISTETFTITQTGAASSIDVTPIEPSPSAEGFIITFTVVSNDDWVVESDVKTDILNPSSGHAGTTLVTANLFFNKTNAALVHNIKFTTSQGNFDSFGIEQPMATVVTIGDVEYAVKWLKDGRLWMNENLRYLPSGKTPSSDPSEESGIWYPNARTAAAKTEADSVVKYGYLYNAATIFGVEAITEENYKTFEKAQGICPEGWHIPTEAEIKTLLDLYWDAEVQKGAPIADMKADGINMNIGGFRMKNTSIITGTYAAAMPGYIFSSTGGSYKVNSETGAISSFFKAAMFTDNKTFQRVTIAMSSSYGGCSVRCILDE
jgi:uncharacterized protein (TIGR02145 family)